MTEELTRESFLPHLGSEFRLEHGFNPITLELVEVSEMRSSRHTESFSLVFRGQVNSVPQAMYRFHHAALGEFGLFITPVGQDRFGLYYEAVFNHVREDKHQ